MRRRWPGRSSISEIVKFFLTPHLLENNPEEFPDCSTGPQPHVRKLMKASSNVSIGEERGLEYPVGLTIDIGL